MLRDFRDFALRGSVVDLTVGFVVGAAFTALVQSGVSNVLMPPLGLLVGDVDLSDRFLLLREGEPAAPYATFAEAQGAGAVTLNYGLFVDELIAFVIIAFAIFLLVRGISRMKRKAENTPPGTPVSRPCPFCLEAISVEARRCPHCTSELGGAA